MTTKDPTSAAAPAGADKGEKKLPPPLGNKRCDACGAFADRSTDGTEVDETGLGRPSIPKLNVCAHHKNWPHSVDAKKFALEHEADIKLR